MEAEMEEKRMMQALNKEFHDFGRKISDAVRLFNYLFLFIIDHQY
jgi:nucleosome binding factor SPN SPT16 subunit